MQDVRESKAKTAGQAFVVLNPVAGHSTSELRGALRRHFREAGWSHEVYETTGEERLGDVVVGAIQADSRAADLVIAAGGDGTVSGVAGGIVGTEIPMGVLPVGTGNAFARELGIPLDTQSALELLTGDHAIAEIDAMAVGDRFYVLNVSVGISGLMMRDTDRAEKRRFGRVAYVWTGLRKLFGYQPHRFNLIVDGRSTSVRASEVAVANSGALGGPSLRWSPQVELDDGRIDLCIIRAKTMFDYLSVAASVVLGRQRKEPGMRHIIVMDHVVVDSDAELPVQADGEFIGQPPVEIGVAPRAVRVVVPRDQKTTLARLRDRISGPA